MNLKKYSATGNRTPVSRVTGGDTHHYTIVELPQQSIMHVYKIFEEIFRIFHHNELIWTEFPIPRRAQDHFLEIILNFRQFSQNSPLSRLIGSSPDRIGHDRTSTDTHQHIQELSDIVKIKLSDIFLFPMSLFSAHFPEIVKMEL